MRTRIIVAIVPILAATTVATMAATVQASSSHREHFMISGKTIRGKEGPIKVLASGPIRGTGTARFIEHGNISNGTFRLPGGKVFITFSGTRFVPHLHPRACTATFEYDGTYTIHGGTRLYRNATGKGAFTEHRTYIGQRDETGHCLRQAPPAIITAVNHARGSATLRAN
jgi:hypothetical protein